jgi:polysaccharide biosynthesis protein PslH
LRLLFLANRIPYPPYRGDKLKIYNLARRLSVKHELHLVTFTQTEEDKKYISELEKVFKSVHTIHLPGWRSALNCINFLWNSLPFQVLYFRSKKMQQKLDEVITSLSFDAIHVQHIRMAPYLANKKDLSRILDLPDAFSLYWERRKKTRRNLFRQIFENIEQKRLLRYEPVLMEYQLSLVCSSEDKEYLETTHKISNIKLLPNGVDLDTFKEMDHDYSRNHRLLFTGNMDYAPNVDAVVYFVEEIFPLITRQFPSVKFIIAGQRPVEKVQALANDNVLVTGFIKDLAAEYNEASVVVAPLRFGAGTQNKVLEAMAMAIPVVCSNIGFSGLGITSGEGAIMETEAEKFANAVCELLASEKYRHETGSKGKQVIRQNFDWDVIALKLEGYFKEVSKTN